MALKRPLVNASGTLRELSTSDTLDPLALSVADAMLWAHAYADTLTAAASASVIPSGPATIDGRVMATGELALLGGNGAYNGLWTVNTSIGWTRPNSAQGGTIWTPNTQIRILYGVVYSGQVMRPNITGTWLLNGIVATNTFIRGGSIANNTQYNGTSVDGSTSITANGPSTGSSPYTARTDHVHAHGYLGPETGQLHNDVNATYSGYMTPADKAKLDTITTAGLTYVAFTTPGLNGTASNQYTVPAGQEVVAIIIRPGSGGGGGGGSGGRGASASTAGGGGGGGGQAGGSCVSHCAPIGSTVAPAGTVLTITVGAGGAGGAGGVGGAAVAGTAGTAGVDGASSKVEAGGIPIIVAGRSLTAGGQGGSGGGLGGSAVTTTAGAAGAAGTGAGARWPSETASAGGAGGTGAVASATGGSGSSTAVPTAALWPTVTVNLPSAAQGGLNSSTRGGGGGGGSGGLPGGGDEYAGPQGQGNGQSYSGLSGGAGGIGNNAGTSVAGNAGNLSSTPPQAQYGRGGVGGGGGGASGASSTGQGPSSNGGVGGKGSDGSVVLVIANSM